MDNILDLAPCFYFSCTDEGVLTAVNETLCTGLGYTKEDLLGKKVDVIFTLATRIFQQTHFFPLLKMQGKVEEIFISLQTKNHEQIPVLLNAARNTVNGEAVIVHIGIVVHNRKKFEAELIAAKKASEKALRENTALVHAKQELQQHMEQLDQQMHLVHKQNEELRQFNRVVTHDLQEPLRKLSVFANMLLESKENRDQKTTVEKIIRVSDQMRSLVSGLQQYVWLTDTPVKLKKVELNKLLLVVQQLLRNEFPHVRLIMETEAIPVIHADRGQMQLLFYQLLSNVIRFRKAPDEAYVSISANTLQLNKFQNISEKYQYTDFLRLQVTDKGIGFDATYKEQAFELFKRFHAESGRGVGLSLCKKIINNHYGTISIDSIKREGTTVTILLPMDSAATS